MYRHPALCENLEKLRLYGCHIMDPDAGELACGVYGRGRMPEPQDIYAYTRAALTAKDFQGIAALVTAGPTREPLDPVRFLSNPSTGQMGYSLARALSERGASVTLISGPTNLTAPAGVEVVKILTADEMYQAVTERYDQSRLVIKAAAVSDFRPARAADRKAKKNDTVPALELALNRDILLELGKQKGNRILVGFAAETEDLVENAQDKLRRKNLDLIIVNDLKEPGAGFAVKTNRVSIIDRSGDVEELPLMEKEELAHRILDRILKIASSNSSEERA
jgi:phosphopantothenoylcysteine decarboxylase / phosphopantothenate---cysteine ligase